MRAQRGQLLFYLCLNMLSKALNLFQRLLLKKKELFLQFKHLFNPTSLLNHVVLSSFVFKKVSRLQKFLVLRGIVWNGISRCVSFHK